jgi:hypothetical protein
MKKQESINYTKIIRVIGNAEIVLEHLKNS